jgi:peptidoglycan/LPS O-acetylase OafA/YrhL
LVPLEAYRGIASLIVLVHHFFLGFSPETTGLLKEVRHADSLIGSPFFVLFNGTGAVSFFFVLSGFVLCWGFFQTENASLIRRSFFKRWPRLAGPVVLTTIASCLLFKWHLYYFAPAAEISHSPWLGTFAYGGWTPGFHPSMGNAIRQGIFTFWTGQNAYNTNLWTMRPEFLGSLLVFVLAMFIHAVLRYKSLLWAGVMLGAGLMPLNDYLLPFIVGVILSAHVARPSGWRLSPAWAMGWIGLGLYLLGYAESIGAYSWGAALERTGLTQVQVQVLLYTLGSALIIQATMSCDSVFRFMDNRVAAVLGRLSFPLYLVHVLVICSASSAVFVALHGRAWPMAQTLGVTFGVTLLLSLICAWPLMRFDEWWTARTSEWVKRYSR